ncbi:hypothetical protein Tco_0690630 [Tanacetum coccineum]
MLFSIHSDEWKSFQSQPQTALRSLLRHQASGRSIESFQDDAKYDHVGQDTRSQDGKDDKDKQGKDLKISELKIKVKNLHILIEDEDEDKTILDGYGVEDENGEVLRDFLLHRSSINNSASLSNKFEGCYFVFKFGISGLLHQVITAIADRMRDNGTSQSKQNLQSSSTTFITYKDLCLGQELLEYMDVHDNDASESSQPSWGKTFNPTHAYYNGSCTSKDTEDPSWSTSFKTRRTRKTSSALEALWKTLFVLYLYLIGTLSKLEYKFQDQENSEDIFSFGSALEDFICVVFVLNRNIVANRPGPPAVKGWIGLPLSYLRKQVLGYKGLLGLKGFVRK